MEPIAIDPRRLTSDDFDVADFEDLGRRVGQQHAERVATRMLLSLAEFASNDTGPGVGGPPGPGGSDLPAD